MHIPSPIASVPFPSANGAASYQPGATPQVSVHKIYRGPTARPISGGFVLPGVGAARGWDGLSALGFILAFVPGALPQAGMAAHLWCWGTRQARDLEQTIAGSLPLPLGEDRGEGAQRMAEILEA